MEGRGLTQRGGNTQSITHTQAMASVPNLEKVNGTVRRGAALDGERIALFSGAYNHIADGVTMTLNRLVAHLHEQGADVLIFAPTIDEPPVEHVGELVPIPSFHFYGYSDYIVSTSLTQAARARLDAFAPTLIHVATPDFLGFKALRYAKKHGIPLVSSYHTHFAAYLEYYWVPFTVGMVWKYLRWYYAQCEHLYVPSESMAEALADYGITHGIRLWQRGVDMDRFHPSHRSAVWRQALGIDDDEVVITFVSRLVWEKGLKVYAEVIEGLTARGIPHRSLIVGDGPARSELVERLPDTLFTGHLEGEALARAYASSDVFLFPSDTETFGNVTLEAMASGLPAVCADATGSRSLVVDGQTGLLAPPFDAGRFLKAAERLVTDHPLRREMGWKALERAQTYAWSAVLDRIVGYYVELLRPETTVSAKVAGDGHAAANIGVSQPVLLPPSSV